MIKKIVIAILMYLIFIPILHTKAQNQTDTLINKFRLLKGDFFSKLPEIEPGFSNPWDHIELIIPENNLDLLARDQNAVDTDNFDNMPVLKPGNNYYIRNFKPDTSKGYSMRIVRPGMLNPIQQKNQISPPDKQ